MKIRYSIINSTNKSIINSTMNNILTAQELKTRGVKALSERLKKNGEVIISVRGENSYVVMSVDHYNYLKETELEAAIARTEQDIAAGKFKKQTVAEHLKDLKNV